MFSHVMIGANDLDRAGRFYDALFGSIGGGPGVLDARGRLIYARDGGRLLVTRPIDGRPATPANGGTIGFAVSSPEMALAWRAAGIAAGGAACEDPPGPRETAVGPVYVAYLRDPDGNKLCALHRLG